MNRRYFLSLLGGMVAGVAKARTLPADMSLEEFRSFLAINPYDYEPLTAFSSRIAEEEHPKMQAHYLALAYMGFWLKGDLDMAKKAYSSLKAHHPDSFYLEQLSPERMKKACPDCRRPNQRKVTCTTCRGTNVCPTCKGKKVLLRMGREKTCHTCNGTGKCPDCDNRGFVQTGTCRTCGGTGEVVNKERLMIGYKQMLKLSEDRIKKGNRINIFGRRNREGERPEAEPK